MTVFVADAGPLIGLARIERLGLLEKLYGTIWIPPAVASELRARSARPGASSLAEALRSGWLEIHPVDAEETSTLLAQLDVGEAEAILLAMHSKDALLILDDRRGRRMARKCRFEFSGSAAFYSTPSGRGIFARSEACSTS